MSGSIIETLSSNKIRFEVVLTKNLKSEIIFIQITALPTNKHISKINYDNLNSLGLDEVGENVMYGEFEQYIHKGLIDVLLNNPNTIVTVVEPPKDLAAMRELYTSTGFRAIDMCFDGLKTIKSHPDKELMSAIFGEGVHKLNSVPRVFFDLIDGVYNGVVYIGESSSLTIDGFSLGTDVTREDLWNLMVRDVRVFLLKDFSNNGDTYSNLVKFNFDGILNSFLKEVEGYPLRAAILLAVNTFNDDALLTKVVSTLLETKSKS